ncbi:MAG: N-6 DNA methylase, partial [Planctomycetota bacterium]
TGGFLVESFLHLQKQVKTVADRRTLQTDALRGFEAKPLPFLLCQMNLLLHGLESPQIDPGNTLRFNLTELGDRDRVDVILTNPPFGGEEEAGIKANFPEDKQTGETALLFLQLIMRKLKRPGQGGSERGGRAGVVNRMINGYLLRDVINKVNEIHFTSSDEIHTLGHLYETMLREMRDAAGDSGEFYTPRPVVRFMVEVTDPRLGEVILDPACGTGGFLVESFNHLEKQCRTVQHRRTLQEKTIFGGEAKPLPYLLCQMNLLLHGLEFPQIDPANSLRHKLTDLGVRDRVDVILTNPPFGGEEEAGIKANFPEDKQTAETALLFLQLIMRKLKRPGQGGSERGGRAGVVVPNGTLFGDGVCARIKEQLLKGFNLHTVVRLPNGVFAPYTSIPTNLLFFDASGPTKTIWYYEQPLPESRKNYSKTKPLQYEEFAECLKWWGKRKESDRAWKVAAADVLKTDADGKLVSCNLDLKNPRGAPDLEHLPPEQLVEDILVKERRIMEIMGEIKGVLAKGIGP